MKKKKYDLAIINRSFWPDYPIVGEGLLQLAESFGDEKNVIILSQGKVRLKELLDKNARGRNVDCKTYLNSVDSSMSIIKRVFQSVGFMAWVFLNLVRCRPRKIYISTDPPIIVPFIVALYSKLYRAKYVYHLQDIHPEITSIHLNKFRIFEPVLKCLDNFSLRNSSRVIVLSEQMKKSLMKRSDKLDNIVVIDNPAVTEVDEITEKKIGSIIYCGNAGRLQRIPLLISSIRRYLSSGGALSFEFVGGGVYKEQLELLANEFDNVNYYGVLPAKEAAKLTRKCQWGLMPIEDAVTDFAFPSKSSTYAVAGVSIIAVCGKSTSVAKWVLEKDLGIMVEPNEDDLVRCFINIEAGKINHSISESGLSSLRSDLSFNNFVFRLKQVINDCGDT